MVNSEIHVFYLKLTFYILRQLVFEGSLMQHFEMSDNVGSFLYLHLE